MKKQFIIPLALVIFACIFVSCSAKNESAEHSTTALTDVNGFVHYYDPVTDSNGSTSKDTYNEAVFAEIVTDSEGVVVTDKNGNYVTNKHTTVLNAKDKTKKQGKTTGKNSSSSKKSSAHGTTGAVGKKDDNDVKFTTSAEKTTSKHASTTQRNENSTQSQEETTTGHKKTEPATDKDGWITKWY